MMLLPTLNIRLVTSALVSDGLVLQVSVFSSQSSNFLCFISFSSSALLAVLYFRNFLRFMSMELLSSPRLIPDPLMVFFWFYNCFLWCILYKVSLVSIEILLMGDCYMVQKLTIVNRLNPFPLIALVKKGFRF